MTWIKFMSFFYYEIRNNLVLIREKTSEEEYDIEVRNTRMFLAFLVQACMGIGLGKVRTYFLLDQ